MFHTIRTTYMAVIICLLVASTGFADEKKGTKKTKVPAVLNFKMKGLDGKTVDLSKFQGKVVLFVNVASECGCTPQYAGLQKLHKMFAKKGLVIVGVPCNQFGEQEPGTDKEIAKFCKSNYKIEFVMLSKVKVNGKKQCPLYKHLTSKKTNRKFGGPVTWNFNKFLIGRDGRIVARFGSGTEPLSKDVLNTIKKELAK